MYALENYTKSDLIAVLSFLNLLNLVTYNQHERKIIPPSIPHYYYLYTPYLLHFLLFNKSHNSIQVIMPSLQLSDYKPSSAEMNHILLDRKVYSIEDADTGMSIFGSRTPDCILKYIVDSNILLETNYKTLIVAEYPSISTEIPTTVLSIKQFVLEQYEVSVVD